MKIENKVAILSDNDKDKSFLQRVFTDQFDEQNIQAILDEHNKQGFHLVNLTSLSSKYGTYKLVFMFERRVTHNEQQLSNQNLKTQYYSFY